MSYISSFKDYLIYWYGSTYFTRYDIYDFIDYEACQIYWYSFYELNEIEDVLLDYYDIYYSCW